VNIFGTGKREDAKQMMATNHHLSTQVSAVLATSLCHSSAGFDSRPHVYRVIFVWVYRSFTKLQDDQCCGHTKKHILRLANHIRFAVGQAQS